MKVLVTGGAGYIGSHLVWEFLNRKCDISIIDNLELGSKSLIPKDANITVADISDEKKISGVLQKKNFDVIIHLAAYTKVADSIKYPKKYYENNFEKSKEFFKICIKNDIKKFIFSSTCAVYGNSNNSGLSENTEKNPLNAYSDSKWKMEQYLEKISKANNLSIISLRYFNVTGSDDKLRCGLISNPENLIKALCEFILGKRKEFIVNGTDYDTKDGSTVRDFIHVSDLVDLHYLVTEKLLKLNKSFYEVYNCGYGKGFSVLEIVNAFEKIIKKKIDYKIGKRREGDAKIAVANVEKLLKEFNWKPKRNDLEIILRSSLNWEKKIY